MDSYPSEPHIQQPMEDTECTACDGRGVTWEMYSTPTGPGDRKIKCTECDGTGSGYEQWANGHGPHAETDFPK